MDYSKIIQRVKSSVAFITTFNSEGQAIGTGSGFLFLRKNIVVTCNHVIKDANSLFLKFPDTGYIGGKVLLRDEEHDIALINIDNKDIIPLEFGDESKVKEGLPVIFSGYPVGLMDLTTHQGIISAIITDQTGITSFLIDGTVNSGNSGCPLMNEDGRVIGVVNAKRRVQNEILEKVESMKFGAVSLHGQDMVEIYQALVNNVQLGIGYAIPASYIPDHKEKKGLSRTTKKG